MSFFNKKEEVIDIQLTRFGKQKLSQGIFKPTYYQFFDDDIIYNTKMSGDDKAGFTESQNDSQVRILEKTPKLKLPVNRSSCNNDFIQDCFQIEEDPMTDTEVEKRYSRNIQEKILLYPLSNYEKSSIESTSFHIKSYDELFNLSDTPNIKYQFLTGHGIYKKVPQIEMESTYTIVRYDGIEMSQEELDRRNNPNNSINLKSNQIKFLDKSEIHITGSKILLSVEEINAHFNLLNFELEIYEIDETTVQHGTNPIGPTLRRIDNIDEINKLFHIKSDSDVKDVKTLFGEKNNWYRSGE